VSVPLTETSGTIRPVLQLAGPVLIEQVLVMLVGLSDRALTGHYLATEHLAAITLMTYLLWMLWAVFQLVAAGATAMVARAVGAGRYHAACKIAAQAVLLGLVVASIVTTLAAWQGPHVIRLLNLEGRPAELAIEYLTCLLPVIPLVMMIEVGIGCFRAAGDMVIGLAIMALVNLVNVSLAWSLVLGLGPLPRLGWRGIGLGTACGYAVGGLVVLTLLLRGRSGLRLHLRQMRPNWGILRRLLNVGLPGGADSLSVVSCQLWFLSIINQLGALASAAHGVAIAIESLAYLPGTAFQLAATTLAGQFLGAGDPRRASRTVWMACLLGGLMMGTTGVLFFTQAGTLAWLLVGSAQEAVVRQAIPLVQTVAFGMPPLAITMVLSGALRGAGDTRWTLVFTLVGFLAVRLPSAYWLAFSAIQLPGLGWVIGGWGLGVIGTWYAMVTDLSVRALLLSVRFLRGRWQQIRV
jgi:putative MATE family efflux protein